MPQSFELKSMRPAARFRLHLILEVPGSQLTVGRDDAGRLAIVIKLQIAAAGLLQIEQLESTALGLQVDGLPGQLSRDAHAAEPVEPVATSREKALRLPTARLAALLIESTIARERPTSERVAATAIPEALLQERS